MPSNAFHCLISKLLLGKDGKSVHSWMDEPSKHLGRAHRRERHDILTVAFLKFTEGTEAAKHAVGHILTDKLFSGAYNDLNKKFKNLLKF